MRSNVRTVFFLAATIGAICVTIALLALPTGSATQTRQKNKPQTDKRDTDRQAIQQSSKRLEQLFKKGDAQEIANLWTEGGELINVHGDRATGRDEIAKTLAESFKKNKDRAFKAKTDSIRFPSKNSAVEEGTVTTRFGKDQNPVTTRYSILHVREDGNWRFALVREWEVVVPASKLQDVTWIIGQWRATNKETQVDFSFQWSKGKAFILGDITVTEGKKVISTGKQIIGRDPAQDVLRSWNFMFDGSYGHGVWIKDGDRWIIDTASKLADGREADANNIITPLSNNEFTWQSINRVTGEETLPDTAPIKVQRVKSAGN